MGAAPSREVQEGYLEELKSRRHKSWRAERRRKEISLLPLTRTFMHHVQPGPSSRPTSPHSGKSGGQRSRGGGSSGNTSGSSRKDYFPARRVEDGAPPSSLPFMQQLYATYLEPSTQFYYRKESWGTMDALPPELIFPTIESFYEATVGCYDAELYDSNDAMQHVLEEHLMKERIAHADGVLTQKGAEPAKRPKKAPKSPKIRPVPCAICFEYPTCSVSQPPPPGSEASPAESINRNGAPYGSVVFAPYCSFMVIGFVGLVPVRHSKKASALSFLRPPATTAGDEGEGFCVSGGGGGGASVEDENVEYELVTFIAKSAGEQHLGRALFQAAFLYTEQCRRAGLFSAPLPSTRFSCFLTDVPALCFLREVRLRCADANWTKRLARALRRVRLAGRHLAIQVDRATTGELCTFMAECYEKLSFQPPPTSLSFLFFGFVGDAGTQILPSSAASPSVPPAPLPQSGSSDVKVLLKEWALREKLLNRPAPGGSGGSTRSSNGPPSRGGSGGSRGSRGGNNSKSTQAKNTSGNRNNGNNGGAAAASGSPTTPGANPTGPTVQLYCIVGTARQTVGRHVYPHGTVLEQTVEIETGNFVNAEWAPAVDRSGQERPPLDFYEPAPEDTLDYSLYASHDTKEERKASMAACDVLLAWSKDLYLGARVAEAKDPHWVGGYPLDFYTAGRNLYKSRPTPAQMEALKPPPAHGQAAGGALPPRTSPLTAANVKALTTPKSAAAAASRQKGSASATSALAATNAPSEAAPDNAFYLWEWTHQQLTYVVALVPNFVRAQQRLQATMRTATSRNNSNNANARRNRPGVVDSVDPTSEANVSSAASQSARSGSEHGSSRSARSGDTYHTAASSHSTMSNFALTQGRRNSRQKRYFLSLGTETVYENGVPVSGQIPPIAGDRSSRAMSDDGGASSRRSGHGGFGSSYAELQQGGDLLEARGYSGYGGVDDYHHNNQNNNNNRNNSYNASALDRGLNGGTLMSDTPSHLQLQQPQQPQQLSPASNRQTPQSLPYHPFTTQPLQRRLSGGVSQGARARRNPESTGGLLDSLYEGAGDVDEYGLPAEFSATPNFTTAATGGIFPATRPQLSSPHSPPTSAGRRGMYGPAQALTDTATKATPPSMKGSTSAKFETPVMGVPGNVQHTHRGTDGQQEYRWDWRGGGGSERKNGAA